MTLRVRWLGRLSPREIGRYLLLGSAIYTVSLSVMYCLTALLGLGELTSYALVQLLIGCTGFLVARRWVFRAREGHLGSHAGRFLASSASFRLLNLALYSFLWSLLAVPREMGILAATALLLPVKYVVEKTLIFNRRDAGQHRAPDLRVGTAADPSPLW